MIRAFLYPPILFMLWLIVSHNDQAHGAQDRKQYCPRGAICLLLDNSTKPADGDECAAARPDLGRPYFTASKRDRSNEPYHSRTCWYSA